MGWRLLLGLPAILLVAAHVWRWLASRWGRRVHWFPLRPAGAEVQWTEFFRVPSSTRRWLFPGRVLVARFRDENGETNIWFGISGSKQPESDAESMARAAGAHVGPRGEPSWPDRWGVRWRMGYTEPAPGRRERDATDEYLRSVDQRTIPDRPTFPNACHDRFNDGDAFVAICKPSNAPTRIRAMCITTAIGLDLSFTEAAEMRRGFLFPGMGVQLAAAAAISSIVAGLPLLDVWNSLPPPAVRFGAVGAVVAWASLVVVVSLRTPKALASLLNDRAPGFPRRARKGKLLPVWQLGEWSAGDALAGTTAPMRRAPPQALSPNGALIGNDPFGQECRLPDELRYRGVITYGDPGSGKTTFLLNVLAHDAARRARGEHVAIIWIETKGEGTRDAVRVMRSQGCEPLVLMGSVAGGPRLELIDRSRPIEAGRLLTEAIRYGFEEADIYEASADVLAASLQAATAFPVEMARDLGLQCDHAANVIHLAFLLLGGIPEQHKAIKRMLKDHVDLEYRQKLERYFDRTQLDYNRIVEPARNKLSALLAAGGLFEPLRRPEVTFEELLHKGQPTVLHMGHAGVEEQAPADDAESAYTEYTAKRTAAMSMFMLWHTIQTSCNAWQHEGKAVAIFSDELVNIAGFGKAGLEIVQAMADQGRSRGVQPVFGTQRSDQLVPSTRVAVDSFATQAIFRLRAPDASEAASRQLFEAYTPQEISALPTGHCAVSLAAEGHTTAAFTLHPANLSADSDESID